MKVRWRMFARRKIHANDDSIERRYCRQNNVLNPCPPCPKVSVQTPPIFCRERSHPGRPFSGPDARAPGGLNGYARNGTYRSSCASPLNIQDELHPPSITYSWRPISAFGRRGRAGTAVHPLSPSPLASFGKLPSNPIAYRITSFLAGVIRSAKPRPRLRTKRSGTLALPKAR